MSCTRALHVGNAESCWTSWSRRCAERWVALRWLHWMTWRVVSLDCKHRGHLSLAQYFIRARLETSGYKWDPEQGLIEIQTISKRNQSLKDGKTLTIILLKSQHQKNTSGSRIQDPQDPGKNQ